MAKVDEYWLAEQTYNRIKEFLQDILNKKERNAVLKMLVCAVSWESTKADVKQLEGVRTILEQIIDESSSEKSESHDNIHIAELYSQIARYFFLQELDMSDRAAILHALLEDVVDEKGGEPDFVTSRKNTIDSALIHYLFSL